VNLLAALVKASSNVVSAVIRGAQLRSPVLSPKTWHSILTLKDRGVSNPSGSYPALDPGCEPLEKLEDAAPGILFRSTDKGRFLGERGAPLCELVAGAAAAGAFDF